MKNTILILIFLLGMGTTTAQTSCKEIMDFVTSQSYGSNYYSYSSDAIRQVTFYEVTDEDYNHYYFAVVQFIGSYKKYIYQVGSNTELNYSMYYLNSAGKAFWKYIEPYNDSLGCAPDFD